MTQPPKVRQLGQGSLSIIGDGWSIQVRIVGRWRPRLLVAVYRDGPEPEIPHGEVEWQQAGWRKPPPFNPDPDLIGHLEGNKRSLRGYRRLAERLRREASH